MFNSKSKGVQIGNAPAFSNKNVNTKDTIKCRWSIVADDRERRAGWDFRTIVSGSKRGNKLYEVDVGYDRMETADYTIISNGDDLRDHFCIERKSLSDLAGSLTGGRERLEREFVRMEEICSRGGETFIIIEGSLHDTDYDSGASHRSIVHTYLAWRKIYSTEWIWAGSKRMAEYVAFQLMSRANYLWLKKKINATSRRLR